VSFIRPARGGIQSSFLNRVDRSSRHLRTVILSASFSNCAWRSGCRDVGFGVAVIVLAVAAILIIVVLDHQQTMAALVDLFGQRVLCVMTVFVVVVRLQIGDLAARSWRARRIVPP
jgi:magnesium-transporting ATPase (P-type)